MQSTQPLRMFLALTLFSGFAAACAQTARPLPLARTPPMGWNSWNHFAQRVTDADVRAAADAMVANGMRDAGYIYVNIDDSWEGIGGVRATHSQSELLRSSCGVT
jgi:alpha-galactosidase